METMQTASEIHWTEKNKLLQTLGIGFGALAEFERELIRERTNAGLTSARSRGRMGG